MSNFVVVGKRALHRGACVGAFVLLASPWLSPAYSSPDVGPLMPAAAAASAADAVGQYLIDKGLVSAAAPASVNPGMAAPGFVTRVRDKASDMVLTAMNFLGVPYRRGGDTIDSGFDCSGFTRQVFETSLGLVLPRRADEQAHAAGLVAVKRDELQPGDLVFFNTLRRTFSHVGIYLGDGKFIHSPKPGGEVRVEDMRFAYWTKRFTGGRRAEPMVDAPASIEPQITEAIEAAQAATPVVQHHSQRKHVRAKH
jgi:cell wall-associated NlpC family hydrolase